MLLPWPEQKDIKLYPNETQQSLATINRCLIRLLDNDKFLYRKMAFSNGEIIQTSALTADVKMANAYVQVSFEGLDSTPSAVYFVPLYQYDS